MSQQGLNDFLEAAKENEDLKNLLFDSEDLDELAEAAQQRDFEVEKDDLEELSNLVTDFVTAVKGELDEEQLEQVAGGGSELPDIPIQDLGSFGSLRSSLDSLEVNYGSTTQLEMTKIQSLSHKYNEAYEACSNLMKTNFQSLAELVRNL